MGGESFLSGRVTLHPGDAREVLRQMPDASIDSAVMDPPYALVSIGKRFGKAGAAPASHGRDGLYARASAGFMGQQWDTGETAFAHDRVASKHPTIKPVDLMQWLCRLVTPPGGVVLDAFAGTGTTGEAAWREGFRAVLVEREPTYCADIRRRLHLAEHPTKRAAVAKTKGKIDEFGPLFEYRAAE